MRRRFPAFVAAAWSSIMMLNCTAILGVGDVPNPLLPNDPDSSTIDRDSAVDGDAITDGDVSPITCELGNCDVPFTIASHQIINGQLRDGGFTFTFCRFDAGPTCITGEINLADASSSLTPTGGSSYQLQEIVSIEQPAIPFVATAYGSPYEGFLATNCDASTLNVSASLTESVSLPVVDGSAVVGCDDFSSVSFAEAGAPDSGVPGQLQVCFTGTLPPDVSNVTYGVVGAASGSLSFQYESLLAQAISARACLSAPDSGQVSNPDGG